MYEFWIEADNFFNIFSVNGRERDKYTESETSGQITRKRDCPTESGTVGMHAYLCANDSPTHSTLIQHSTNMVDEMLDTFEYIIKYSQKLSYNHKRKMTIFE